MPGRRPRPKGFTLCTTGHWLNATQFTAVCLPAGSSRQVQVFRFSTAGGAPVSLTGSLARTSATQYGFVDQWKTSRGTAVQVFSSCGVDRLGLVKGRSVGFLPRQGEGSAPMGVVGDAAHYFDGSVCDGPSWSISRLDLRTNMQQLLAGRGVNKGRIGRDADLVDSSR